MADAVVKVFEIKAGSALNNWLALLALSIKVISWTE